MKLVNIGFGNLISADRVIAIVSPDSSPIKRIITEAKSKGTLIDATQGRKTHSVMITDSDHIILSYLTAKDVALRAGEAGTEILSLEVNDNE